MRMPARRTLHPWCILIGLFLTGALAGCGAPGKTTARKGIDAAPAFKRIPPTQRPYQINGIWYHPLPTAHGYRKTGIASWYGKDFHGRKTSNGETYNMYGISAAHKTLPMGTHVEVRNIENGRTLRLTINDRGPFVAGRIIDLSYGAARRLDILGPGTAKVEVTAVATAAPRHRPHGQEAEILSSGDLNRGNFAIQVGAFGNRETALKLANALTGKYRSAEVLPSYSPGKRHPLYRVVVGKCTSLETAESYENALRCEGFPDAFTIAQ